MGVMPQPILDRVQPALDHTLSLAAQRLELGQRMARLPAVPPAAVVAANRARP